MASFWFISAPLYSHTDWGGFLLTAQALRDLGHDVLWVSQASLRGAIEQRGLPFAAIEETGWLWPPPPAPDLSTIPPREAVTLRYRRALDTWLHEERVAAGVESLLALADEIGSPDAFVCDPFLSAAALAAEKLDVAFIVAGWPAQANLDENALFPVQRDLSSDSQQRIRRLCDQFGIEGAYFSKGTAPSIISPLLHLTYFTPDWYIMEQATMLPQTKYVGGSAQPPKGDPPQWLQDIPPGIPLGVVTLGTIFTGDLGFFSWAAAAVAMAKLLPIVIIGYSPIEPERKEELKRALPGGTRLLAFAPFDHLLPRTRLMIHHGGMGTTHAAITHGIRQIVVPHAADQRIQAERVARAKVGLHLTAHDVRQGQLPVGANALMEASWVADNARQLAQRMAQRGGPTKAAELILQVIRD